MKKFILLLSLVITTLSFGQIENLNLTNVLVIGQMDKPEDRYSIEVNLTELLTQAGIKAVPSLNVLKMGSDASLLATDSVQQLVKAKGIDTYVIVSVRGYDKKFNVGAKRDDFATALNAGSLFSLYRDEVVSVSFEFQFFRDGQLVASDIVKCGNVSDRDSVIKRFRKKVAKRINKKWK